LHAVESLKPSAHGEELLAGEAGTRGLFVVRLHEGWPHGVDRVRNFQARNNLRAMRKDDLVLYYHSVSDKQVVGVARVEKEHYADPTAKEGDWSVVDLVPVKPLARPVPLVAIKADKVLKSIPLVRQSRLSVSPLTVEQFRQILKLGETKP
jgi:predicted RNA-binding protein with PUA-like domain